MNDLQFAFRQLQKNPGFTAVAVLTLALGIGANTAIFAVVNYVLLRPGPGNDFSTLVSFARTQPGRRTSSGHSYPDILDYREQTRDIFAGVAAYTLVPGNVTVRRQTDRLSIGLVTDNYFSLLGIQPVTGRGFLSEEGQARDVHLVAIVSQRLWRRINEESSPHMPGETRIRINNREYTVIGVVSDDAARMARVLRVDAFVPAVLEGTLREGPHHLDDRGSRQYLTVARLKPGVTLERAQAACGVMANRLAQAHPESWKNDNLLMGLSVVPETEARVPLEIRGNTLGLAATLFVVVALILLIGCANLANFLLARAMARRQEMGVRLALGATRTALIRQLLTENFLLALLGAAGGLVFCDAAMKFIAGFQPPSSIPLALDVQVDWRTLIFTMLVALVATLFFGLVPALRATRIDLTSVLKEKEIIFGYRLFSLRNLLIIGQVTASLILLAGAGLFLQKLIQAQRVRLGFEPDRVALLTVNLQTDGYSEARGRQFYDEAIERLRTMPGVQSVDTTDIVPLGMDARKRQVAPEGREAAVTIAWVSAIGPRYLQTMSVPVLRGRGFTDADREGAPRVAIINEALAALMWPGQNPLGRRLRDWNNEPLDVIGVTPNGKYHSLEDSAVPYVYLPWKQQYSASFTFVVKTHSSPGPMLDPLRRKLVAVDNNLTVFDVRTMNENLALAFLPRRVAAAFFTSLALLALGLAALGLYGVVAYTVSRRTREVGIRIALGAQKPDVLRLILRESMLLISIGTGLGLIVSFIAAQVVASQIFGLSSLDLRVFGEVTVVLGVVGACACWLPARRATRVDPMEALRYE